MRATRLSNKLLEQGYVKERLKSSLRKFYGRYGDLIKQYEVSLSQMLNDICDLTIYNDNPSWSDFVPNSTFYFILSGFHRTFATGVACRQGTLPPPDTWSRPFWTCICSTCWDQSISELVVILPDYALRISLGTFSILLLEDIFKWFQDIFTWIKNIFKCYHSEYVKLFFEDLKISSNQLKIFSNE